MIDYHLVFDTKSLKYVLLLNLNDRINNYLKQEGLDVAPADRFLMILTKS